MVAHHEVLSGGNFHLRFRALVGVASRHVAFEQRAIVQVNTAVFDAEVVARQGDNALDVAFGGVARVLEDDDVSAVDGADPVSEFVDKKTVLILQHRDHAGTFHTNGLVKKQDDEEGNGDRNGNIAHPG